MRQKMIIPARLRQQSRILLLFFYWCARFRFRNHEHALALFGLGVLRLSKNPAASHVCLQHGAALLEYAYRKNRKRYLAESVRGDIAIRPRSLPIPYCVIHPCDLQALPTRPKPMHFHQALRRSRRFRGNQNTFPQNCHQKSAGTERIRNAF